MFSLKRTTTIYMYIYICIYIYIHMYILWIDLLKRKENKPISMQQPARNPLPITYTNIVLFKTMECLCNHKSMILVYIFNGKGSSNWLWSIWVQWCFFTFLTRSFQ